MAGDYGVCKPHVSHENLRGISATCGVVPIARTASAALLAAGASTVAALVIGRFINPGCAPQW
jgi:hypothetical protein